MVMIMIILLTIISLYGILIIWTKSNLGAFDNSYKLKFIATGIISTLLISIIIVLTNQPAISNADALRIINITNISIFAPLNALIIVPFIARIINRVKIENISKEKGIVRVVIAFIIFCAFIIFEIGYIKGFQR